MGAPAAARAGENGDSVQAPPSAPRSTRGAIRLSKPPKGHGRLREVRTPPRSSGPPRYTNQNIRPGLMTAALAAVTARGYQALRVVDITDPANVSRQAFYAHFRDKRHCLCEALDPRLAAIERIAADPAPELQSDFSAEWSAQVIASIDEVLGEHFGSAEGTKGRLLEAMAVELETTTSLAGVRVGNLVKRARVPQGDFYRCFTSKRECFAALYEQRLEALLQSVETSAAPLESEQRSADVPELLTALGEELAGDPGRARLLVLGDGQLPAPDGPLMVGSKRGDLREGIARLLGESAEERGRNDLTAAGSLLEVVRTEVVAGDPQDVGPKLIEAYRAVSAPVGERRRTPHLTTSSTSCRTAPERSVQSA